MKNKLKKYKIELLILLFYIFIITLMTWPLISNISGFVLPQEYPNINHSDSIQHTSKIDESWSLLKQGKNPIIIDKTDISQIYIFLGILATKLLNISTVTFHNIFFMFVMLLSGIFAYLLMYEFTKDKIASFIVGLVYLSSHYISYAYYWGHSNTMQIQWIPFIFLAFERMLRHKRVKDSILFALTITLQLLSGSYNMVHLSFVLPLYFVLRLIFVDNKTLQKKIFWKNIAVSLITILITAGYYLYKRATFSSIPRTLSENMMNYWRLDSFWEFFSVNSHLYTGTLQILFAVFASYLIFSHYRKYKTYIPFLIIALVVLLCMIGPFSIISPYYLLFRFWPFFDGLRVPFRMYPFFLLSISMLTGLVFVNIKSSKKLSRYRIQILIITISIILLQIILSPWLSYLHIYYL